MLHHTVQRMLSSDTSTPIPEAGLALLRVATGVIVAWLHGWHKVVRIVSLVTGAFVFIGGGRWSIDYVLSSGWRSASRQARTSL